MEYTQRSENRSADALATLGSQVPFKRRDTLIRVSKQEHSIIGILKIKEKIKEAGHGGSIKELRDYTLIKWEIYRRLPMYQRKRRKVENTPMNNLHWFGYQNTNE